MASTRRLRVCAGSHLGGTASGTSGGHSSRRSRLRSRSNSGSLRGRRNHDGGGRALDIRVCKSLACGAGSSRARAFGHGDRHIHRLRRRANRNSNSGRGRDNRLGRSSRGCGRGLGRNNGRIAGRRGIDGACKPGAVVSRSVLSGGRSRTGHKGSLRDGIGDRVGSFRSHAAGRLRVGRGVMDLSCRASSR
jgi:hypothetical protein